MSTDSFAAKLLSLRKRAGLSLTDLSARCGLSRQQLTKYENGQSTPNIDVLPALAATLGCTPADLLPTYPPVA